MLNLKTLKTTTCLLAALLLTNCAGRGNAAPSLLEDAVQTAEAIIQPWISDAAPGVSVAVSLGDEIVFARGVGLANLEHEQSLKPDSVFQVASVSKQFTAFATLLLISEGKIALDEDIRVHLPELHPTETVITVRHLLDHTSGLRERNVLSAMAGWMPDDIQTEPQLLRLAFQQRGVNFAAGEEVEYSNTGYSFLAEIVARVSEMSFSTFMKERIFAPLGMNQTSFPENRNLLIPGRASSYYPDADGFKNIVSASELKGSTGLYTTALDLLLWAENFETQTVGNQAVFAAMAERAVAADGASSTFAKGQELREYKGLETWSHGGRDAGYRSFIMRIPGEDFEVSILSNRTDFDTAKMAFALADTFLSSSREFVDDFAAPFEPLAAQDFSPFAGTYEFFPGVVFRLKAENGGLTFSQVGAPHGELEPLAQVGEREFLLNPNSDLSIEFSEPQNGRSESFGYKIGLHGTLIAKQIELGAFKAEKVDLSELVGEFESEELDAKYMFSIEDGALTAKHSRRASFILTPYQNDAFIALNGPLQKIELVRDSDGSVEGFYASASLVERVLFKRTN